MNKQFSVFLDLIRFLAAFAVLISHAKYEQFGGALYWFGLFGHDAVLIFFVLSGYVIAYVSDTKESTLKTYMMSRLARLYSVVIPVLILTFGLTVFLGNPSSTLNGQAVGSLYAFLSSMSFLNQSWGVYLIPFSNNPFWSISYEFWYYVIFAFAFYFKGMAKSFVLIPLLFAGPNIVILLPVWLLGVLAYRLRNSFQVSAVKAGWLAMLVLAIYLTYRLLKGTDFMDGVTVSWLGLEAYQNLQASKHFLNDYLVGFLVFGFFVLMGAHLKGVHWRFLEYCSKSIRFLASYTFTLYLLHFPLLVLFSKLGLGIFSNIFVTLVCVFVFGTFTERKKHVFSIGVHKVFDLFSKKSDVIKDSR